LVECRLLCVGDLEPRLVLLVQIIYLLNVTQQPILRAGILLECGLVYPAIEWPAWLLAGLLLVGLEQHCLPDHVYNGRPLGCVD
jgi:hypothetical protein